MPEFRPYMDLDFKTKLFKEWLDNGGLETIVFPRFLKGLMLVKQDAQGKVIPDTVNSEVRAAMNALLGSSLMAPYYSETSISEYKTLLQKSLFFDQYNIETEEEFDQIFQEYLRKE